MKRILLSLLTIAVVASVGAVATQAYFSDTETSTANTFIAGKVDLKIDSQCTYNGQTSAECGTWQPSDLTVEKFFNFIDIKPGDWGENTISMHVEDNDYWACIDVSQLTTTDDHGVALAQGLQFFAWDDINGDNTYDPANEYHLFTNVIGPAYDVLNGKTYTLADGTGAPLLGGVANTKHIGLAWCAGTLTVDAQTGHFTCDGTSLVNDAQNGSVSADIAFRVEQSRNNTGFRCTP